MSQKHKCAICDKRGIDARFHLPFICKELNLRGEYVHPRCVTKLRERQARIIANRGLLKSFNIDTTKW